MSRYSESKEAEFRAQIRQLMAMHPAISAPRLAELLGLERHYVAKMKRKVETENVKMFERLTVQKEMQEIQALWNVLFPMLATIALSDAYSARDRIAAAKTILTGKMEFMDKKFDAGLFKRQLGQLDVAALTPEQKELRALAMRNVGRSDE